MNSVTKKALRARAHTLKPIVLIGQSGLTEAVINEIEIALDSHELIKVRIRAEREDRGPIRDQICTATRAELIQTIGQIIVIFREKPDS